MLVLLKMFRKVIWLAFICLAAAVFAAPLFAQEKAPDDVIKVSTTLVSVPVIVSDRLGRYIPDLVQKDFNLLQDDVEQKIDFFAAAEEPINIALLIDTSQSTRDVLGDIRTAAKKMVKMLNADDRAMIVSFDHDTHVLSSLTSDKKELEKAIEKAKPPKEFGTTLRDAVDETVREHFSKVKGRKAVILLTDGKDHDSYTTSLQLVHSVEESDVIVYTVYFNTEMRPRPDFGRGDVFRWPRGGVYGGNGRHGGGGYPRFPPDRRRDDPRRADPRRAERMERENENAIAFLHRLSDATAGRFYDSRKTKFKEAFALIVDELRHQYRLGYYPPEETGSTFAHALKVKVARPESVVRARSSYRPTAR